MSIIIVRSDDLRFGELDENYLCCATGRISCELPSSARLQSTNTSVHKCSESSVLRYHSASGSKFASSGLRLPEVVSFFITGGH